VRHVKNRKASASSLSDFAHVSFPTSSPRIFPILSVTSQTFRPQTPVVRGTSIKQRRQTLGRATIITTLCGFKAAPSAMTGLAISYAVCHWFIASSAIGR
jgi:hypothetical protein